MKVSIKRGFIAGCGLLLFGASSAYADSTTGTTFTVNGRPVAGSQVSVTVVVTGKHLVDGPGSTVNGGDVKVTVNGNLAAQARAAIPNSSPIDQKESGCVRYDSNVCTLSKWVSRNTTVTLAITLPKGVSSYEIAASYTGDTDSHGSTSATATLTPIHPDAISAALPLLLN